MESVVTNRCCRWIMIVLGIIIIMMAINLFLSCAQPPTGPAYVSMPVTRAQLNAAQFSGAMYLTVLSPVDNLSDVHHALHVSWNKPLPHPFGYNHRHWKIPTISTEQGSKINEILDSMPTDSAAVMWFIVTCPQSTWVSNPDLNVGFWPTQDASQPAPFDTWGETTWN
jgi:hypothetical protein